MHEQPNGSLQERVDRLEATVRELQRSVGALHERLVSTESGPAAVQQRVARSSRQAALSSPSSKRPAKTAFTWKSEDLLNKVGIGLLLLGVIFLFKYSIDQGWITPRIRIAFGLGLGASLLVAGLRIAVRRPPLSQVLLGGGVATLYVTVFSAYQLYNMVSHPVAFASMAAVTLLTFSLSIRQHAAVLAVIGALGGLATPFLLYTGSGSLPGLVGYTCLLLTGTSAIFLSSGWRSLLFTYVLGGWLVLLSGYLQAASFSALSRPSQVALQSGILFCWIAFWALPTVRDVLHHRNPLRWPSPAPPGLFKGLAFVEAPALGLTVSTPLIALAFSSALWPAPAIGWGWVSMTGSVIYGLGYAFLRRLDRFRLAQAHGFTAALLMSIALIVLLDGAVLLLALALEGALLYLLAYRHSDDVLARSAHVLLFLVGLVLAGRLMELDAGRPVLLNARALLELAVIAVGAGLSAVVQPGRLRDAYRLAAHLLLLGWLLREFSALPEGQAFATIAWGTYAVLLLMLGFRLDAEGVRKTALATLLLVVAKLFVVDLAEVSALWRVLLFLSFGGVMLLLSYFIPSLWRAAPQPAGEDPSKG